MSDKTEAFIKDVSNHLVKINNERNGKPIHVRDAIAECVYWNNIIRVYWPESQMVVKVLLDSVKEYQVVTPTQSSSGVN